MFYGRKKTELFWKKENDLHSLMLHFGARSVQYVVLFFFFFTDSLKYIGTIQIGQVALCPIVPDLHYKKKKKIKEKASGTLLPNMKMI